MIAFLDTMVLVWWVRRECTDGQQEMIQRADWLMADLDAKKADVIVSAVSIAEFLRGADLKSQARQMAVLEQAFICWPFDAQVAQRAAALFQKGMTVQEYADHKAVLKGDLQIVASAIASKADVVYSHDGRMRKLVELSGLTALDLPTMPPTLFD